MKLTKTLNLPNPQSIKGLEDIKTHLQQLNDELQRAHRAIYDTFVGEVMAETPNWRFKEISGDLRAQKKISGTWTDEGGYTE